MELVFQLANEVVVVRIRGTDISFANSSTNFQQFVPIDSLKLDIKGILKEFPNLEGKSEGVIREEGLKRFKEKIKNMENENRIKEYITEEFKNMGYVLIKEKKEGFR